METSPTYRIVSQNETIVADGLSRSAPAIQLHEGALSKGDKHPKELALGESSLVAYPLTKGRLICRVTRTDGHPDLPEMSNVAIDLAFAEPDPVPEVKKKSTVARMLDEHRAKEQADSKPVRRGRGKKSSS